MFQVTQTLSMVMVVVLPLLLTNHVSSAAVTLKSTPSTSGRSTDYISCDDPCNGGDVNYEVVASVRTMKLLNYTYRGRTYSREGDQSFFGPTLRVQPGQSLWIKLVNEMNDPNLGPDKVTPAHYFKMLKSPGEKIKYDIYKHPVDDPSQLKVDAPNLPGHYDHTNLHLHGLDVQVHMFDPVGTHNPDAPHIKVAPGSCYCYQFHVPDHHPEGMYWYHPHLHGATAVQMWGGMIGILYVEKDEKDPTALVNELAQQGVTRTEEFVIFDPALRQVDADTHNLEVDQFLMGQTTLSKIHPFLVNQEITPTFHVHTHQVLHLRALCATVENENTFIIYPEGRHEEPWDEAALPFWVIGSDGVMHAEPKEHTVLVMAGGQREELLTVFDQPGRYVVSQQGIQGMQFFDMYGHPHDQLLAIIEVTDNTDEDTDVTPVVPIPEMRFTPGYAPEETIQIEDIVSRETIVFSMGSDRDTVPFPQYYVNGKAFDGNRLDFFAHPGEAREYTLVNANHNVHPFHIHVNRFQVQEMGSELSTVKYPVLEKLLDFDPSVWRDTVVVPPNGRTRIWVQYKNYTGKTLFHCHFLAHEDTGMMSTLFIGPPDQLLRWKDHAPLIGGILLGSVLMLLLMVVATMARRRQQQQQLEEYAPVTTMNTLKSKAMD